MARKQRVIHTRGSAAETPNWMFGLTTQIPRSEIPEICEGLAYLALEGNGGFYYYPFYEANKMGAAFEWYLPHRNRRFGFKVGVEFWVDSGNLETLSAYVLYGEDHPKRDRAPDFSEKEKLEFQRKIIETVELASNWRVRIAEKEFFTVHYIELPSEEIINDVLEFPSLKAYVLPTVCIGKERRRVSAVIQTVSAHFREEAKDLGGQEFVKLCALLTLAVGRHYRSYKPKLPRPGPRQFLDTVTPLPSFDQLYPKGKYTIPRGNSRCSIVEPLRLVSEFYSRIPVSARLKFDDSVFAYCTAQELIARRFSTVATVALIAALNLFRRSQKCPGKVQCSECDGLEGFRHDRIGEAASIAQELCDLLGLDSANQKSAELREMIRSVYSTQRSSYVHDAVLRHGEFRNVGSARNAGPTTTSPFSDRLIDQNELETLDLVTRRALLQHMAQLSGLSFNPASFGIEPGKFECKSRAVAEFVVPQNVLVGVRA